MIVADRDYCIKKYRLSMIKEIEDFVSDAVEVNTPFNVRIVYRPDAKPTDSPFQ